MYTASINVNNLHGCGDWTERCRWECINEEGTIPRLVHFIKLDQRKFTFREWVSVMSARKFIKPDRILVYTVNNTADSCWWRRALPFIEHHILPREVLIKSLNGVRLKHSSHHSDFIRNSILYHVGGVYLDTGMIVVKPFDDLLFDKQVVVSRVDTGYNSNAMMLARTHSCFMCKHARKACENYNGRWITPANYPSHKLVERKEVFKGLKVIDLDQGFIPVNCTILTCSHKIFDTSMEDINFNISHVYSLHLSNSVTGRKQIETLQNYKWISTSRSAAATAIRMVLPMWFNETHLDEEQCIELPKGEQVGSTSPMIALEGVPTKPTVMYNRFHYISLLPKHAYITCIPTGHGFCIWWYWVLLLVAVIACISLCLVYVAGCVWSNLCSANGM